MRRTPSRSNLDDALPSSRHQAGGSSSGIAYAPLAAHDGAGPRTALPALPRLPPPRGRHWRPSRSTLLWACTTAALVVYFQLRLKELTASAEAFRTLANSPTTRPAVQQSSSSSSSAATVDGFAVLNETLPALATSSCEVCHLNPANPLCEYGYDNIRMSRAYEGSGARLRKVLAKALRGEEVVVSVLGASITAGHSVPPGYQRWQDRFFDDFKKMFPRAKMNVGAVGAMDSMFFSFCFGALVPEESDLFLVELDINNEPCVAFPSSSSSLVVSLRSSLLTSSPSPRALTG